MAGRRPGGSFAAGPGTVRALVARLRGARPRAKARALPLHPPLRCRCACPLGSASLHPAALRLASRKPAAASLPVAPRALPPPSSRPLAAASVRRPHSVDSRGQGPPQRRPCRPRSGSESRCAGRPRIGSAKRASAVSISCRADSMPLAPACMSFDIAAQPAASAVVRVRSAFARASSPQRCAIDSSSSLKRSSASCWASRAVPVSGVR